jgi:hypothetical protein
MKNQEELKDIKDSVPVPPALPPSIVLPSDNRGNRSNRSNRSSRERVRKAYSRSPQPARRQQQQRRSRSRSRSRSPLPPSRSRRPLNVVPRSRQQHRPGAHASNNNNSHPSNSHSTRPRIVSIRRPLQFIHAVPMSEPYALSSSSSSSSSQQQQQQQSHRPAQPFSTKSSWACAFHFVNASGCYKGQDCKFSHEKPMCEFWEEKRSCPHGEKCKYAHNDCAPRQLR